MSDQSVLREYLVSLGFKIDQVGSKKFGENLGLLDKKAMVLGKTVLGVATATAAMVTLFTHQMEKLYYSSKLIGTSVGNLQALKFGAAQIGISGERMQGALEGVARSIRSNPGLAGLIQSFGIKVEGRDMSDVALDFVKQLNRMPPHIAERYAGLFGIDPDTLFLMRQGMAEMDKAAARRKQMAADAGLDTEAAARAAVTYANTWRDITEQVGIFKDVLSIALLPQMQEMANVTKLVLGDWVKIVQEWKGGADFWAKIKEGVFGRSKDSGVKLSPDARARLGLADDRPAKPRPLMDQWRDALAGKRSPLSVPAKTAPNSTPASGTGPTKTSPNAPPASGTALGATKTPAAGETKPNSAELFARLEKQYALPPGLLDRVWKQESSRGKYMLSGAGAKGHMGWMDASAKQYGVTDPNDLENAATGTSKYFAQLLKQYGGDLRKASAAYNWGPGNVAKHGLGSAPKETRDYMDAVGGAAPQINQETKIIVNGTANAAETAAQVAEQQRQVNAEMVRNFASRGAAR